MILWGETEAMTYHTTVRESLESSRTTQTCAHKYTTIISK